MGGFGEGMGIKDIIYNWKVKKERKKKQEREEYFKRVNKEKKYYVCRLRGCKNKLKGLTYQCPYCHKWFCEQHRLPEDHKCPSPRKPKEMKKGYGTKKTYSRNERDAEAEKEMNC